MGKSANKYDRSQGWRVQKQRREEARSKLPAWYWRLATFDYTEGRDVEPEDYDEDISELGPSDQSSESADEHDCECDSDASECHCGLEDEEDNQSEKTCEGTDAELYYELKDERKNRKRELLRERQAEEKAKKQEMDFVIAKEDEVNAAYAIFKKDRRQARKNGQTIPIDFTIPPDRSRQYKLFSSDHVQWLYDSSMYPTQRADFHYVDDPDDPPPAAGEEKPLFGDIYINAEANCQICPVPIPTRARRKDAKLESIEDKYDVRIKFFHDKYLKLSLPRDMVFHRSEALSSGAPERFEFVGILRDLEKEKEKEERRKVAEEEKKNRPASPRESYFEMYHPMGWWAQSRW